MDLVHATLYGLTVGGKRGGSGGSNGSGGSSGGRRGHVGVRTSFSRQGNRGRRRHLELIPIEMFALVEFTELDLHRVGAKLVGQLVQETAIKVVGLPMQGRVLDPHQLGVRPEINRTKPCNQSNPTKQLTIW